MSLEQSSVWCGIAFQKTIYILHEKNQMGFLLFLVKISLGEKKGGHIRVPALLGARIRGPRWPRSRSATDLVYREARAHNCNYFQYSCNRQQKGTNRSRFAGGPHARALVVSPALGDRIILTRDAKKIVIWLLRDANSSYSLARGNQTKNCNYFQYCCKQ